MKNMNMKVPSHFDIFVRNRNFVRQNIKEHPVRRRTAS